MAGKREGIAIERLRKDPIAAAVADNVPQAPVVAEAGMPCGRTVDANIADRRTAANTTTDCPGRIDRVNERTVGGTSIGIQDLGKTEWIDTQNE